MFRLSMEMYCIHICMYMYWGTVFAVIISMNNEHIEEQSNEWNKE